MTPACLTLRRRAWPGAPPGQAAWRLRVARGWLLASRGFFSVLLAVGCSSSDEREKTAAPAADNSEQAAPAPPAGPRFQIVGEGSSAAIEVTRLPDDVSRRAAAWEKNSPEWAMLLTIRSAAAGPAGADPALPPMAGSHEYVDGVLTFHPRFPLARGVKYIASLARGGAGEPWRAELSLPPLDRTPVAEVAAIFPTAGDVPENLLKFYLVFSQPMSRGEAYRHVRLLEESGERVDLPFYELDEELWDPAGERFTLRFDPGRIKRGLKPREDHGPALEAGKRYKLAIDASWHDAEGRPLKQGIEKSFRVGPPDDTQPDPRTWTLRPPPAETAQHLAVLFPEPLDRAMLERSLTVLDPAGDRVAGSVTVGDGERRWQFDPKRPWKAGRHTLAVDADLEDLAGNSPARPFEVDVQETVTETPPVETVYVPFDVQFDAAGRDETLAN